MWSHTGVADCLCNLDYTIHCLNADSEMRSLYTDLVCPYGEGTTVTPYRGKLIISLHKRISEPLERGLPVCRKVKVLASLNLITKINAPFYT